MIKWYLEYIWEIWSNLDESNLHSELKQITMKAFRRDVGDNIHLSQRNAFLLCD